MQKATARASARMVQGAWRRAASTAGPNHAAAASPFNFKTEFFDGRSLSTSTDPRRRRRHTTGARSPAATRALARPQLSKPIPVPCTMTDLAADLGAAGGTAAPDNAHRLGLCMQSRPKKFACACVMTPRSPTSPPRMLPASDSDVDPVIIQADGLDQLVINAGRLEARVSLFASKHYSLTRWA